MTTLNVVRQRTLIDAGPSSAGWSSISDFLVCERLYYLKRVSPTTRLEATLEAAKLGAPSFRAQPLVRGSIGHVGLAHEYTRRAAAKAGLDPDVYYPRNEAMALCAETFGKVGKEMLPIASDAVDAYFEHYKREDLNVVAIEAPVAAVLADGKEITQRLDMVIKDTDGRFWVYDHKFVADTGQKTVDRYTLSGQFLLMIHFGRMIYGAQFGGVRVNLVGVHDHKMKRASPEPAPAALADFPSMVVELRKRIAAKEGQPGSAYLPAFNEAICCGPYGHCSMFDICQWEGVR